MRLVQRQLPPKAKAEAEILVADCVHPGCVYSVMTRGVFCYFHEKIHAGLISSKEVKPRRYDDKKDTTKRLINEWDVGRWGG